MKKRNKVLIVTLCTILISIILVVIAMMINPLLRTEASIRRHLLSMMPNGTSMEDVIRTAENNERWTIRAVHDDAGLVLHPTTLIPLNDVLPTERTKDEHIIGTQSIRVSLGNYRFITTVFVVAHFAFDENGELIEIIIHKYLDLI